MKRASVITIFTFTALLAVAVTGCRKTPKDITPIPAGAKRPGGTGNSTPVDAGNPINPDVGVKTSPIADIDDITGMIADREHFKADTIYFDYDKAAVRTGERSKLENVAAYLKGNRENKVKIEGHCDERGTAEYNRTLGDRRAQAAREYLIGLGVDANRIFPISYGKDKPASPGLDDASRAKNRRDEFVLLKPKP